MLINCERSGQYRSRKKDFVRRASDHGPAASVDGVFIPVVEDAVWVMESCLNVHQSLHCTHNYISIKGILDLENECEK